MNMENGIMTSKEKVQVQRINRRLAKDYEGIRKTRSYREEMAFGRFYLRDLYNNIIRDAFIDLDDFEREITKKTK